MIKTDLESLRVAHFLNPQAVDNIANTAADEIAFLRYERDALQERVNAVIADWRNNRGRVGNAYADEIETVFKKESPQ